MPRSGHFRKAVSSQQPAFSRQLSAVRTRLHPGRAGRLSILAIVFLSLPVFPLSAGSLASSSISIHHDRAGCSATIRGSLPSSAPLLDVNVGGDVTIRGGRAAGISYTITARFTDRDCRGSGEKAARQAAAKLDVAIERRYGSLSLTFPWTASWNGQTVRLEVPRGASKLSVISVAGNIDIDQIDGSVITRNGAGRTLLDHIGGDAEIRTAGGATTMGLIGGNVRCFSGGGSICARTIRGESVFETCGGEIYAAEALGAVHAYTGAGSIRIGHAGSSVTAATQGGPIEVGRAEGMVIANNSGGPIRVSSAPGVHCSTASGAIRLTGVSGSLFASTTLGNIIASLLDARLLANSFLQTGGGDITVLIPSNISVTLKATSTGDAAGIVSDFPVRLTTRGSFLTAEGPINGGGPLLRIAGKSGTIFIKRQ